MSKFEDLLKKWNGGILRGAKIKLANEIKLPHTNISNWLAGRQNPSETAIKKMSKLFKKTEEEIKDIFGINDKIQQYAKKINHNSGNINVINMEYRKEFETINLKLDLILERLKNKKGDLK